MRPRWLKRWGLSNEPPLVPGSPTATPANTIQRTPQTQLHLDSLLDLHADLPYSTVVEELEEFVYQSELSQA